jgi:hypothetical protein
MSLEGNKTAVRDFFAAIDSAQSMAPLDAFAASAYTAHFPGAPSMTREVTKGFGNGLFQACPGPGFLQQVGAIPAPA